MMCPMCGCKLKEVSEKVIEVVDGYDIEYYNTIQNCVVCGEGFYTIQDYEYNSLVRQQAIERVGERLER